MRKVSVIIVNYNTKAILRDCLANLFGKYDNMQIIVVDNASSDGSSDMVRTEYPEVLLIESENKGLAHGYNRGLEVADGDYILFLGSDTFVQENTIAGMVAYLEAHSGVGIATCKLVLRDGGLDMDAHRGFPTPWAALTHFSKLNRLFPESEVFNRYFLGYKDMDSAHEIDLCISHFMLVSAKVFKTVGKWDEDFFVYGEDVDFCYRAKQGGWKIMYLPQFSAVHYKGVSVGIRNESADISSASSDTKKKMRMATTEAMELFYTKHYKNKYPAPLTVAVLWGIKMLSKLRG